VRVRFALPGVLATLAVTAAGCGSGIDADGAAAAGRPNPSGTITVLAAASLTGSFTELGKRFEAANPGTRVRFGFGPSSGLARQVAEGAPADVFASASARTMDAVVRAGEASRPTPFATNALRIAVPPGNPAGVTSVAELAAPGVKVAVCQPQVPCGAVAAEVLGKAKVTVRPVTAATDVKAVLAAVRAGEVDAGLVYVTDVLAAGGTVEGVEIPAELNASTRYSIAVLEAARNPATAGAFVDYVLSAEGRTILAKAGFAGP
jgi:molybdate transport system substrate-binding protein